MTSDEIVELLISNPGLAWEVLSKLPRFAGPLKRSGGVYFRPSLNERKSAGKFYDGTTRVSIAKEAEYQEKSREELEGKGYIVIS